jgi:hypothetical protein
MALALCAAATLMLVVAAAAGASVPGKLIWAKTIGTKTSDAGAWVMAGGPKGTTAIAGWKTVPPTGQAVMVAKYDAAGHQKWVSTYVDGTCYAEAVACDRTGNVFVAATTHTDTVNRDFALLKYDPAGHLKWARPYAGPTGFDDWAVAVAVDRAGNVAVVGASAVTPQKHGFVVIRYDTNGNALWPAPVRFDPDPADPNSGMTEARDAVLDGSGNVYVTGSSEYKVSNVWVTTGLTVKFAAADGARKWAQIYEARHNQGSYLGRIRVQGSTVACVGGTEGAHGDALVVKYDGVTGAEKSWNEWGAGNTLDEWWSDLALDGAGNVYVTGDQGPGTMTGWDKAWTMKLNKSLAKVLWRKSYLPKTKAAAGSYIARDGSGNVYVSGYRDDAHKNADVLIIKYGPTGVRKWLTSWSGGGPDDDHPAGLVLGTTGGVYVGGQATTKSDSTEAMLLKYQR